MEKEFVPYEQALKLKELGFDGDCFAIWSGFDEINFSTTDKVRLYSSEFRINDTQSATFYTNDFNSLSRRVSAPTFTQTFKWFREKYNLIPDIQYYGNWNFEIFRIGEFAEPMDDVNVDYTFKGGTYEESELECLKKLIEIVKNK